MSYRRAANLDKNIIFQEYFNDEQSVRRNGGVPTDVVFDKGVAEFNGSTSKIVTNKIYAGTVHSFRCRVNVTLAGSTVYPAIYGNSSTNAYFLTINDSNLFYNDGTGAVNITYALSSDIWLELVTVRNGTSVKFYLDGVLIGTEQTLGSNNETIIDQIGARGVTHFIDGDIELVEIYNKPLTPEEVSNLYTSSRYSVPHLDRSGLTKILHVTAQKGVVQEISDQNTITEADVSVFKDGSIRVMDFNGSSSLIESTLSNDVNTIIFWAKPKTADESIIDIGGGNTITIVSGVLTAAWADDLYVNGESGTAVNHNEWSLIACRVDTSLVLTDIDIGKISTAFYDGMLSEVVFVDGAVSDAEISQVFSSSKHLYQK